MKIEHLAIWVKDLEGMKAFYSTFFGTISGEKYQNPNTEFTSYFLRFKDGPKLELMYRPDVVHRPKDKEEHLGITHFAISVGTKKQVDRLTERIREAGYEIVGEPRTTGDGYYESVVLDPENNRIEITE